MRLRESARAMVCFRSLRLTETPAFAEALKAAPPPKVPLAELLRDHWPAVLGGTLAAIACFAIFYLATAFALGFGTGTIGIPRETFLGIQLFAILFLALGIIVSGFAADRFGAGAVLMAGCGLTLGVAAMIVPTLGSGQVPLIALFLSSAMAHSGRGCRVCFPPVCASRARLLLSTWPAF